MTGNWLNDAPYGVVHRIASDGTVKGAASFCLSLRAFSQCHNLKIDTHQDNPSCRVFAKLISKMRNHPDRRWIKPNCLSETGQQNKLILMDTFALKLLLLFPTFLSAKQVRNLAHYCHWVFKTHQTVFDALRSDRLFACSCTVSNSDRDIAFHF